MRFVVGVVGPTPRYLQYGLVGGLEPWNFMTFHSVGNFIIPTDFHIIQRGRYTTNQMAMFVGKMRCHVGEPLGFLLGIPACYRFFSDETQIDFVLLICSLISELKEQKHKNYPAQHQDLGHISACSRPCNPGDTLHVETLPMLT